MIVILWACYVVGLAQNPRLVQVKLYNKQMQPVEALQFSFDNINRYTTNANGTAVVRIDETKLPPKNVIVYNGQLEAESWNYSKGILEVIIRPRTTKVIQGTVRNMINEPVPNLKVTVGRVNKRFVTTNAYGEFEMTVPIDFDEKNRSAYAISSYNIRRFNVSNGQLQFHVEEIEREANPQPTGQQNLVVSEEGLSTDTISDIGELYAILRGISLDELNQEEQQELDKLFNELVTYYEGSKRSELYTRGEIISDSSRVTDDVDYLIEQARLEQDIATEFNRIFTQKIDILRNKLQDGGYNLTTEEREVLVADVQTLYGILDKNRALFQKNQEYYLSILGSISDNLLGMNRLEEQLGISEQQRLEQRRMYEQRVLFYTIGISLLVVFLVVLAYFLARIKKQKDKTQAAYQQINDLNEHLEDLVAERTAMLEMTNAELDTFFYKSAHNLRGPLLTIVGLSQIAKMTLNDEAQQLFNKAASTASSMDSMLRKLIMVSHINYPSDKDVVDFKPLVTKIEKDYSDYLKDKKITFEKVIKSTGFVSYPMIIDIILRNLLENSFIFSSFSNEPPLVKLEVYEVDNGLNMLVSDNGSGIDTSQEDKVWRMFYVGSENSSGNGLGLYIAQKAAKTLKGTIHYSRTDDRITRFTVFVPRAEH